MTQTERTEEQLERIRDFVAALRSGEYAQTTNRLARCDAEGSKSYCCEGVAFERYGEALGFELEWEDLIESEILLMRARDPEHAVGNVSNAPVRFWDVMGLGTSDDVDEFSFVLPEGQCTLDDDDDYVQYATLNDDGFTFSQIADMIEWQFLCVSASTD
jgi:hypothetical protein